MKEKIPSFENDEKKMKRRGFFGKLSALITGGTLAALTGRARGDSERSVSGNAPEQLLSQDGMLGEVKWFAGPFAPDGWMFCEGQILNISEYAALYALLGIQYGGNGTSNFALPDFRGRAAVCAGQGTGLTNRLPGQMFGWETHTLSVNEMPLHTHQCSGASAEGTAVTPVNNVPAVNSDGVQHYTSPPSGPVMHSSMIGSTGDSQPHNNMQPSLVMNYIICCEGTFPSRS